ncbi:PD-(D/E)XK nuclease family protein [Yersinia enterocolitica]|nr:PD-(D/E)XK nuclease family protein [Yersinia enterocolitica]EKN4817746.1 PD-(D/E)XK nuclease family protein [Yersinia enterocolitica]EKN4835041.1 PD-(D/E)XK nuclease family protein [Yersinia enterocolitica]CNK67575.1 Uncharacterised protein [Yersinia enterocolitica]HEO0719311.1 PD-(D/E)XK nuclease family protein [Yersinia enterocolitica]
MYELTKSFFQRLQKIAPPEVKEINFFTSGGSGYLENPTSDLMALFMGNNQSVSPWLLKALMQCLNVDYYYIDDLDITSLEVMREARTKDGKFLDLLIKHQDFIIGIEHKTISPINNPFESYEKHLNDCVDNGQMIYCCILKPDCLPCIPVNKWQLINYSQLVTTARSRASNDQAREPFSKWNVFYTEFLNHLNALSGVDKTMVMNKESQIFVTENFNLLIKASSLLKEFETTMIEAGKNAVLELLPDTHITQSINNWKGDYKAIHLAPECWGNGTTGVSLVYHPTTDGQSISYYVNGWINVCDYPDIENLCISLVESMSSVEFLPTSDKSNAEIYSSQRGKELILSFGTPNSTLEEAKHLLKEMVICIDGILASKSID